MNDLLDSDSSAEAAKCDGPDNFHCDVMTFAFRLFILRRERKGGTSNEQITANQLKISRLMKLSCEQPPVRLGAEDERQAGDSR